MTNDIQTNEKNITSLVSQTIHVMAYLKQEYQNIFNCLINQENSKYK